VNQTIFNLFNSKHICCKFTFQTCYRWLISEGLVIRIVKFLLTRPRRSLYPKFFSGLIMIYLDNETLIVMVRHGSIIFLCKKVSISGKTGVDNPTYETPTFQIWFVRLTKHNNRGLAIRNSVLYMFLNITRWRVLVCFHPNL